MLQKRSASRRAAVGAASVGAGVAMLASVFAASAGADDDGGNHVPGNPKCEDLGFENGFKIEATGELPASGTYEVGDPGTETFGDAEGFVVTITVNEGDPATVDFDANTPVNAVIVKAGPGANVFEYEPPVTSDTGLESPKDSISHIDFCFDGETPPPDDDDEVPPDDDDDVPPDHEEPKPDDEAPDDEAPDTTPAAEPVAGTPSFTG